MIAEKRGDGGGCDATSVASLAPQRAENIRVRVPRPSPARRREPDLFCFGARDSDKTTTTTLDWTSEQ